MGRGNGRMRPILRWAVALLAVLAVGGCFGPRRGAAPPPPPGPPRPAAADNASRHAAVIPPVIPIVEEPAPVPPPPSPETGAPREKEGSWAGIAVPKSPPAAAPAPPHGTGETAPRKEQEKEARKEVPAPPPAQPLPTHPPRREVAAAARKPKPASPPETSTPARDAAAAESPVPGWAKQKEVLVYRVDFIGVTMGYARFRYQGKVSIGGKVAYHLNVRAWTSGVLSYIYPVNETIDYYLDAETLAPIRQEFTEREREKDDVAIYDQETGKITYRYRQSGTIRKQVETVPMVYDPVSVAYYFRWRDGTGEDHARNVYAGRKVWQISAKLLGTEKIRTELGEVDTILIRPVIRRNGKVENKGDLKVWFSRDERHVPVRLYARFHKIKDWTLVGELVPAQGGAEHG